MPYLANYAYDIFISYAHGPAPFKTASGEHRDPLGMWTQALVDDLRAQVDLYLGSKDPQRRVKIWMDPKIEGNNPLAQNLKAKVDSSAIMVVVMSHFYLTSDWCKNEVLWFADAMSNRRCARDRVFCVRAYRTDESQWPSALKPDEYPLPGYTFHPPTDPGELNDPFGWPRPTVEDREYWCQLGRLAQQIAKQLKRLEWIESKPHDAMLEPVPPSVGRSVFLGYLHDTLGDVRDEIRSRLTAKGLAVLPPAAEDPVDENTLRRALDAYLGQCEALVLVANEYCGTWPVGQEGGHVGFQLKKAQEHRVPSHLWLDLTDPSKIKRESCRRFIDKLKQQAAQANQNLNHANLEDFLVYVRNRLSLPTPASGVEQLAVVCCMQGPDGEPYARLRELVLDTLAETERLAITPEQNDSDGQIRLSTLEPVINRADTIVVVCFDQDWIWANNVIREIRHLIKTGAPQRAQIFVIGPKDMQKGAFNVAAFKFKTVNAIGRDESAVKEHLRQAIIAAG
jgi:hypothetical protein